MGRFCDWEHSWLLSSIAITRGWFLLAIWSAFWIYPVGELRVTIVHIRLFRIIWASNLTKIWLWIFRRISSIRTSITGFCFFDGMQIDSMRFYACLTSNCILLNASSSKLLFCIACQSILQRSSLAVIDFIIVLAWWFLIFDISLFSILVSAVAAFDKNAAHADIDEYKYT